MRQKLRNLPSGNPDPRTRVIIVFQVSMSSANPFHLAEDRRCVRSWCADAPTPGLHCTVTETGLEATPVRDKQQGAGAPPGKIERPALSSWPLCGSSSRGPPIVTPGWLRAARELYRASDSRVPGKRAVGRVILGGVPETAKVGAIEGHTGVIAPAIARVLL